MVIGDIDGGCGVGSNPARGLYRLWVPIWRCPNSCAPKSQCPKCLGAPMAVPQWLCSKKSVPQMLGCPYCSAPNYSAPTVVPQMQCPSFRLPLLPYKVKCLFLQLFQDFFGITLKFVNWRVILNLIQFKETLEKPLMFESISLRGRHKLKM